MRFQLRRLLIIVTLVTPLSTLSILVCHSIVIIPLFVINLLLRSVGSAVPDWTMYLLFISAGAGIILGCFGTYKAVPWINEVARVPFRSARMVLVLGSITCLIIGLAWLSRSV
jgi:hypothetical protein